MVIIFSSCNLAVVTGAARLSDATMIESRWHPGIRRVAEVAFIVRRYVSRIFSRRGSAVMTDTARFGD